MQLIGRKGEMMIEEEVTGSVTATQLYRITVAGIMVKSVE
jgi:hypothetical protein